MSRFSLKTLKARAAWKGNLTESEKTLRDAAKRELKEIDKTNKLNSGVPKSSSKATKRMASDTRDRTAKRAGKKVAKVVKKTKPKKKK